MGRKKKEFFDETIEPMTDDSMNLPVDNVNENVDNSTNVAHESGKPSENIEKSSIESFENTVDDVPAKPSCVKKRILSTSNLVNVREKPDGEVLFRIHNGAPIIVEETKNGWCKISGYVMEALIGDY